MSFIDLTSEDVDDLQSLSSSVNVAAAQFAPSHSLSSHGSFANSAAAAAAATGTATTAAAVDDNSILDNEVVAISPDALSRPAVFRVSNTMPWLKRKRHTIAPPDITNIEDTPPASPHIESAHTSSSGVIELLDSQEVVDVDSNEPVRRRIHSHYNNRRDSDIISVIDDSVEQPARVDQVQSLLPPIPTNADSRPRLMSLYSNTNGHISGSLSSQTSLLASVPSSPSPSTPPFQLYNANSDYQAPFSSSRYPQPPVRSGTRPDHAMGLATPGQELPLQSAPWSNSNMQSRPPHPSIHPQTAGSAPPPDPLAGSQSQSRMRMLGQLKAVMIMSTGSEHFRTGTATQIPVTLRNNVGTREVQMLDNLGRQVGSLEESVAKAVYGLLECGEMRIMGIVQGPLKATYISPVILSFYANHALAVEILGLFESFGMHLDQSSAETQSTLRDLGQESNLLTRGMSYKARLPTRDDDGLLSLDANSDANVPSVFKGMNFKPSRGEGSSFPREKGAGSEYWARIKGKRNHQRLPQTMVVEKVTDTPEDGKTRLANIKSTFVTLLDLPEMDPPTQVLTPLRRHQKQALYFMVQRETEGIDIQDIGGNAGAPFPKLWIPTEDANFGGGSAIRYRHTLTNIKSLQKPDSMLGGILADDMGLGKTLSIIALVLSMPAAWVRGTRMKFTDSHGDASATASGPVSRSNTRPSGRTATRGRIRPMGRVVRRRGNSASKGKGKEPAIADDTTVVVDSSDDSDFLGEVSMPSRRQHVQESDISDPESLVDDPLAPPSPQSSEKSTALNDLSQLPSDSSDDDYDGAFADGGDQYVVDNTPMTPPPDYDNMATRRKEECERRFAKNYHGRYAGGTLIVCPLSTMGNWEEQVASHVRSRALSIYSYHGPGRIQNPKKLCEYDIVLTTYNVVQSEYSKETKQMVIEDHEPNEARSVFDSSSEEESNTKLFQIPDDPYVSALQAVHWHRIVLDEAHTIKEKRTICSQAAGALTADRRWCLTGTPIQNRLDDLYSLLRFLHAAPLSTWKVWLTYIAAPFHENIQDLIGDEGDNGSFEQGNIGAHRVQRLMQTICLRRMKQQIDMKTNRTMIELPPKFEVIRWLELSEGERRLYKMAEDIARNKYQQMSRNGTLLKNYMHILKIILRLRQLCTHPKLWSDDKWKEAKVLGADATIASQRGSRSRPHQDAETTPAADDGQHIPQAKTERKPKREAKPKVEVKPNAETKPKVETKPKAESAQDIKQNPMSAVDLCSMVMDNVDADSQSQQQTHTQPQPQTQTQTQEVERLQDEDIYEVWAKQVSIAGESVRCEFCHEQALPTAVFDRRDSYQPDDEPGPAVTRCGHISCHLCKAVLFETLMDGAMTECMLCGNMLDQSDVVNIPARIVFNSVSRRRQSQQVVVQMEEGADGAEYEELNRLCQEHDSSTKVATLIQDLKMIRQRKWITDPHFAVDQDDPLVQSRKEELEQHTEIREKSVVFSQWTKMLDIIGQQLEQYGIRFTRLDGTMTRPTRENHLRLFKRDPDVEVLLISLRAGGVGLNLAYATHVFMMDAFWNPSVELQAIDRIHRLGQRHPITVTRYFIKESIEEKIMALQRRKARIVDVSLMDSTRNKGPGSGGSDNEEESLAITTGTHSRQQRLDDLNLLFG